jgi:serine/threonine protein kinase
MHVLQMHDFFYHREHLFIVCELLRDNLYELYRYIAKSQWVPYFTQARVRSIAQQALTALDFMHTLDLIHCDLKPENILIQSLSRCQIKLIDFGSSCFKRDPHSSYVQSRSYRAPEVVVGMQYAGGHFYLMARRGGLVVGWLDGRVVGWLDSYGLGTPRALLRYTSKIDVWSLGCILAELLTGSVLFSNKSIQVWRGPRSAKWASRLGGGRLWPAGACFRRRCYRGTSLWARRCRGATSSAAGTRTATFGRAASSSAPPARRRATRPPSSTSTRSRAR